MKVLLIYPPSQTQRHYSCPMGMLMLAAVLEKAGHDVLLLDANAARRKLSIAEVAAEARRMRPDVIGMTLVTPLVREAYQLAGELRGCGAKLIAGGPHATLLPDEPLEHGFDAVVVGEGEPTIVEAIQAVTGGKEGDRSMFSANGLAAKCVCSPKNGPVPARPELPAEGVLGLVYRQPDGTIVRNGPRPPVAELDALPLPARHLVNPADFAPDCGGDLHAHLFTSRGCPARCAYCAGGLFGKKFRFRSAKSVVDELLLVHRQYGTRHFYFVDDAMTMDRGRMELICRRLIDERLGVTWSMMTRIDAVDDALLALAARAGCVQIDYGVESGHPETLKKIHKPHTVEMVRRVIPLTHRHGIRPVVFFILGFPWEDRQSLEATHGLMREIAPYVDFRPAVATILIPFPGTEIFERYKDEYGFAGWWIGNGRTYGAPRLGEHAFYETVMYRMGAVLDADFFRYSDDVKAKIHEVFRFMFVSNFRRRNVLVRVATIAALDLSRRLDAISPRLERLVFKMPVTLVRKLRGSV